MLDGLDQAHRDHGAGVGTIPSLEHWANLLRVIDQDGAERRELPRLLRLSRRAVRSNISAAERKGWVREVPSGRGMARVEPSECGVAAAQQWRQLRRAAERTWERRAGEGAAERTRWRASGRRRWREPMTHKASCCSTFLPMQPGLAPECRVERFGHLCLVEMMGRIEAKARRSGYPQSQLPTTVSFAVAFERRCPSNRVRTRAT
jgi:hypothetical protein